MHLGSFMNTYTVFLYLHYLPWLDMFPAWLAVDTCVYVTAACGKTWQVGALNVKEEVTGRMLNFMSCWPCISIHPCNKNQLDALFILRLFHQSTCICFGHICSPSSGDTPYMYNNWYVLCFLVDCLLAGYVSFMLTGCWQDRDHSDPANSQST